MKTLPLPDSGWEEAEPENVLWEESGTPEELTLFSVREPRGERERIWFIIS